MILYFFSAFLRRQQASRIPTVVIPAVGKTSVQLHTRRILADVICRRLEISRRDSSWFWPLEAYCSIRALYSDSLTLNIVIYRGVSQIKVNLFD